MLKVLIVEDLKSIALLEKERITEELNFAVEVAYNYEEASKLLQKEPNRFFVALLDLHLPDAQNGEIVDLIISKNIPIIVFTSDYSDEIRDELMSKNIIDYIIKENINSFDFVLKTLKRIYANKYISVLIVDDSKSARALVKNILNKLNFTTHEAKNGLEALEILNIHPEIKLIITDQHMPNMSGVELVKEVRKNYSIDDMIVIGISSYGNSHLIVEFLKRGANDFITKPFLEEEFVWRIHQNLEMLEHIIYAKQSSLKDHLTKIYNRKYLFETGVKFFEAAKRKNVHIAVAMIDIDNFKKVNDTYGHLIGDQVLQNVANILIHSFRKSDIVARFGGEEFCIVALNCDKSSIFNLFERVREKVANSTIYHKGENISVTISIGVTDIISNSLQDTIESADNLLYKAKKEGKNRVICKMC